MVTIVTKWCLLYVSVCVCLLSVDPTLKSGQQPIFLLAIRNFKKFGWGVCYSSTFLQHLYTQMNWHHLSLIGFCVSCHSSLFCSVLLWIVCLPCNLFLSRLIFKNCFCQCPTIHLGCGVLRFLLSCLFINNSSLTWTLIGNGIFVHLLDVLSLWMCSMETLMCHVEPTASLAAWCSCISCSAQNRCPTPESVTQLLLELLFAVWLDTWAQHSTRTVQL